MKKKKILLTLAIASMMGLAGCGETSTDPQTPVDPPVVVVDPVVTGITLKAEGDKTAMDIGTTLKFTATVTGEGDFNKQYTFSVDKEDIATISNEGVLTAKAEGSVVVTATAAGDTTKKSSITITVNEVAVCAIKDIAKNERKHVVGKITALTTRGLVIDDGTGAVLVYLNAAPEGYAIGDVLSVAGKVAEYHNNLQFPKDSIVKKTESTIETTTISTPTAVTAASYDEMAETIKVLTPISFTATAYELESGDKKYTAFKVDDGSTHIIEPTDLPDSFSVVIGTEYNVTGYVAPYYTSSSSGSSYASFYLTAIAPKPIPVTSITVTAAGGATSVGLNETLQMGVTIAPEKASNKAVTWSVDKSDVATIDENGLLTGKTAGTVVVTATAKDGSGVSGTKSIEVLQFKDPVVSLTLGTAPTEAVAGSSDIEVSVTVAGESSTSNFNPAYTVTSSDPEVASVDTTASGIKISPIAAGTAIITVKTTGTDKDGAQLTKDITLEVLGEPRIVELTIAEASALTEADDTKLYKVTGIAEDTYQESFYIADTEGNYIQGYKLWDKGDFNFKTDTQKYSTFKDVKADPDKEITASTRPAEGALDGKKVSMIGNISISSGKPRISNGKYVIESETPASEDMDAVLKVPTNLSGGSFVLKKGDEVITTDTVQCKFGDTFTVEDVTADTGFVLGSIKLGHKYYDKKLTKSANKYTFTVWTYNELKIAFVNPSELTAMSATEALAATSTLSGGQTSDEFSRVVGKVSAINGKNYTIDDGTTKFVIYDTNSKLSSVHLEDNIDVYGNLAIFSGTPELTNTQLIERQAATYTVSAAETGIEGCSVSLSKTSGVYNDDLTINVTVADHYKLVALFYADKVIEIESTSQTSFPTKFDRSGVVRAIFADENAASYDCKFLKTKTSDSVNSYTGTGTYAWGEDIPFGLDFVNWSNNNKGWDFLKCAKKNEEAEVTSTITTNTAVAAAISMVMVHFTAADYMTGITLETATNAAFTEGLSTIEMAPATGAGTVIFTLDTPAANLFYRIGVKHKNTSSANGKIWMDKILFQA